MHHPQFARCRAPKALVFPMGRGLAAGLRRRDPGARPHCKKDMFFARWNARHGFGGLSGARWLGCWDCSSSSRGGAAASPEDVQLEEEPATPRSTVSQRSWFGMPSSVSKMWRNTSARGGNNLVDDDDNQSAVSAGGGSFLSRVGSLRDAASSITGFNMESLLSLNRAFSGQLQRNRNALDDDMQSQLSVKMSEASGVAGVCSPPSPIHAPFQREANLSRSTPPVFADVRQRVHRHIPLLHHQLSRRHRELPSYIHSRLSRLPPANATRSLASGGWRPGTHSAGLIRLRTLEVRHKVPPPPPPAGRRHPAS